MPGKRLSLVCCWGPAASHFPGWILGEGRFAPSSNSVCMATGSIFKSDTIIIINHQLEFSGTKLSIWIMRKGHTNMRFGLIACPKKPLIIAHSGVSRETRCLKVVWSLLQLAYFVYARSESPGEVMRTCRLVGAFATRRCNKNHHLVSRLTNL